MCVKEKGKKEEFMPSNYFNKSSSIQILFLKALEYKAVYKVISENKVHHTIIFPDNCNSTFQYELKNKRLFKTDCICLNNAQKKAFRPLKKELTNQSCFTKKFQFQKAFIKIKQKNMKKL